MTTKDLFLSAALGLAVVSLSVAFTEKANIKAMEIRLKDLEAKHAFLMAPKTSAEQANFDKLEMNPRLCLSLYGTPQKKGDAHYCDLNIESLVGARINTAVDTMAKQVRAVDNELKETRTEFSALNATIVGLQRQVAQGGGATGRSARPTSSEDGNKPPPSALGGGAQLTLPDGKTSCGQAWGSGRCVDGSLVCDKGVKIYFRPGTSPSGHPKAHFICDTPG